MVARLEELQLREPVECPKQRQPQLQQAVMDVATQIEQLKVSLPATSAERGNGVTLWNVSKLTNATMRNNWEN